jgi:hypothetical protein
MGKQEYLIEAMDAQGRWYIVGSDPVSGWAQHYMREHRKLFPKLPLRVVQHPSRVLVVCHDPLGTPFAA